VARQWRCLGCGINFLVNPYETYANYSNFSPKLADVSNTIARPLGRHFVASFVAFQVDREFFQWRAFGRNGEWLFAIDFTDSSREKIKEVNFSTDVLRYL
jgi:hypothetical protein